LFAARCARFGATLSHISANLDTIRGYFKQHRQEYYELLQQVRQQGDWEAWLKFFLRGVRETADGAAKTALALQKQAATDEAQIQKIGRAAGSALRLHRHLQRQPITSIARASDQLELSIPAVTTAMRNLEKAQIVREVTGGKYGRLYAYDGFLKVIG